MRGLVGKLPALLPIPAAAALAAAAAIARGDSGPLLLRGDPSPSLTPVGEVGCDLGRPTPLPPPARCGDVSRGGRGSCGSNRQPYMLAIDVSLAEIMSRRSILRCSCTAARLRPGGRCCSTGCKAAAVAPPAAPGTGATPPTPPTPTPATATPAEAAAAAPLVNAADEVAVPPGMIFTDSCRVSRDWRISGDPVPSMDVPPALLMLMAGRLRDSRALLLTAASRPDEVARANPPVVLVRAS